MARVSNARIGRFVCAVRYGPRPVDTNQQRKGRKGYFAARAPVQISHREENVLDLRTPEPRARRRKRRRPMLPPPVG